MFFRGNCSGSSVLPYSRGRISETANYLRGTKASMFNASVSKQKSASGLK
jgi:hypothetical protein